MACRMLRGVHGRCQPGGANVLTASGSSTDACALCSSLPFLLSSIHCFLSALFFKSKTWPFPPSCSLSVIPVRSHKVAVLLLSAGSSSLYVQHNVWFKSAVIQAVMLHMVLYTTEEQTAACPHGGLAGIVPHCCFPTFVACRCSSLS